MLTLSPKQSAFRRKMRSVRFAIIGVLGIVGLAAPAAQATPVNLVFSDVTINFPDGVATLSGTLTADPSNFQVTNVDFTLSSPDPLAVGHYIGVVTAVQDNEITFFASPINTRLELAFNFDLGLNNLPDPVNFAQLDLTLVGGPTYSTYDISGAAVPIPEINSGAILASGIAMFIGVLFLSGERRGRQIAVN